MFPFVLFEIFLVLAVIVKFKSIPGPIYGGDLYFHNGIAEAIYHGTPVFSDPTNLSGYAFYPWLYHAIVALLSIPLGSVMLTSIYVMPLVIITLSLAVVYKIGLEILNKAVLPIVLLLPLVLTFPDAHPRTFLIMVTIPLFYLMFIRYLKRRAVNNALLVGIAWGFAGLTHVLGTFGIGSMILFVGFWEVVLEKRKEELRNYVIMLITGVSILMLYWAPLILLYHAQTPNPYQKYVMGYYTVSLFTKHFLFGLFSINSDSLYTILTIFTFVGLYYCLKDSIIQKVVLSSILGLYIMGILFILLDQRLIASKAYVYFFSIKIILISVGAGFLISKLNSRSVLVSIVIILMAFSALTVLSYSSSKWTRIGFQEFCFSDVQMWVLNNTNINDVFLSNYESSFALFSISGRKTVLFRRTHASPFVDYNKRSADIIVALLGNDTEESLELLRKYHVKYLYIDDMTFKDALWTSLEYRSFLEQHGIECREDEVLREVAERYGRKAIDLVKLISGEKK